MPNPTDHPDDAGIPKLAFGRLVDPAHRAMNAYRSLALLLGAYFWYYYTLPVGLLVAAALAVVPEVVRRRRVTWLAADLHARVVKIIRSAEYEADRAQDRQLLLRAVRNRNWLALFTSVQREDARARVRVRKYVHLGGVLGGGMWPRPLANIPSVTIHWAPIAEIGRDNFKTRLLDQVGRWYGVTAEAYSQREGPCRRCKVPTDGGWDGPCERVTIRPVAASDLPASVPYPGEDTGEDREAGGRSGGVFDPGKPRWSNWDGGE